MQADAGHDVCHVVPVYVDFKRSDHRHDGTHHGSYSGAAEGHEQGRNTE